MYCRPRLQLQGVYQRIYIQENRVSYQVGQFQLSTLHKGAGFCVSFYLVVIKWMYVTLRKLELFYQTLIPKDVRAISKVTGCMKPCTYRKYRLIGEPQKLPMNPNYTDALLLWSLTDDKMVSNGSSGRATNFQTNFVGIFSFRIL